MGDTVQNDTNNAPTLNAIIDLLDTTSPAQLQDTTLDPNITLTFPLLGDETSAGKSPMRIQSVKEYEEQLNTLMKENFSLKLRIYFLEEKMGRILSGPKDMEEAVKQNIELNVENETIRKELKENKVLLSQALKALELIEQEQNKTEVTKESEIRVYKNRIEELEDEISKHLADKETAVMHSQQLRLEEQYDIITERDQAIEEAAALRKQHEFIENELRNRCRTFDELESEFTKKINDLNKQLKEYSSNNELQERIENLESSIKHKDEEISTLNRILDDKCSNLEEQLKRRGDYRKTIEHQNQQLEFLKQSLLARENMVTELEERLSKSLSHSRSIEVKFEKKQQELIQSIEEFQRKKHDDVDNESAPTGLDYNMRRVKLEDTLRKREDDIRLLENQIMARDLKINKLETENTRALGVIREFMKRENTEKGSFMGGLNGTRYEEIWKRDQEILSLKKEVRVLKDNYIVRTPPPPPPSSGEQEASPMRDFERMPNNENSVEKNSSSPVSFLIEKYSEEISSMNEKMKELVEKLHEKEQKIKKIEEINENNLHILQTKDNRIIELEQEISDMKDELVTIRKKQEESESIQTEKKDIEKVYNTDLVSLVDKRGKEIDRLESELRKRTGNLQELVNKELWDKNREIERLQKRIRLILDEKEIEVQSLRQELHEKSQNQIHTGGNGDGCSSSVRINEEVFELKNENSKLKLKVEDLNDKLRNTPARDTEKLRSEFQQLEENYNSCLKSKKEALDMCSLLTSRLEELALFLKALLKHKSVLGFLGIENQNVIKSIVDRSLDLSRNLSMSISVNEDTSLLQMSSITGILDTSRLSLVKYLHALGNDTDLSFTTSLREIDPLNISVNRVNSTLSDKSLVQLLNKSYPKSELPREKSPLKSQEKSKVNHELDQSESEAWSEPDRSVSLARIGLLDESIKASPVSRTRSKHQTLTTESSSEDTNIRTPQKRSSEERISSAKRNLFGDCKHNNTTLQEEVIKLQNMLKEKEQEILLIQCEMIQKDNQLQTDKLKLAEQYEELKKQRLEATAFVNEAEEKVKRSVEQRQMIEEQIDKLSKMIEELLNQKNHLSKELETQIQQSQTLQEERDNAIKEATEAQKRAESAFVDVKLSEMRLNAIHESYNLLKTEFDEQLSLKLKENEKVWNNKLENLDKDLKRKLNEFEQNCEQHHVLKDVYNEKLKELETATNEIQRLKKEFTQFDGKMNALKENETKLIDKIQQIETTNKENNSQLRKDLHEATLIASQAAVERTKVSTEKNRLEKELQRLENERNHFETQLKQQKIEFTKKENDFSHTITALKQNLDEKRKNFTENDENNLLKQVSTLEKQKNQLELHVSQLENINADLENRLVKAYSRQTDPNETNKTNTSPVGGSNVTKVNSPTNTKDFSGYTSEEIPVGSYENILQNNNVHRWFNEEEQERLAVNSSPDLGIESDQGRFSSLEANIGVATVMRPFLPPLELTQTMNNMLNSLTTNDTDPMINVSEIQKLRNENTILKARLMKTRKTLEDTVQQLAKSNERKKQVEKAVCKQIHKTSLVLRKARANLDSGSENDVPNK